MQHFVFVEPSAEAALENRRSFFLALDTERERKREVLGALQSQRRPTLFVIEPASGKVAGYWPGAASLRRAQELSRQLARGLDALGQARLAPDSPLALLVDAKAATAAGDPKKASAFYERALERAPLTGRAEMRRLYCLIASLRAPPAMRKMRRSGAPPLCRSDRGRAPGGLSSAPFDCSQANQEPGETARRPRRPRSSALRALTANPPRERLGRRPRRRADSSPTVLF